MADKSSSGGSGGGASSGGTSGGAGSGSSSGSNPFSGFTPGFKSGTTYSAAPDDYTRKAAAALSETPPSETAGTSPVPGAEKTGESAKESVNAFSIKAGTSETGQFKKGWQERLGIKKTNSENYQKQYQAKLDKNAAEAAKKAEQDKANIAKVEKEKFQKQAFEAQQRANAFRLKAEIAAWTVAMASQDPETQKRTQGTIQALQEQLGGIPEVYRN
ncbi:MAG: hypothetical protein SFW62_04640 [Alphaproteobacteria bacterium]|nr:hypothetical protein [Alphaproteobacteria bacterium]